MTLLFLPGVHSGPAGFIFNAFDRQYLTLASWNSGEVVVHHVMFKFRDIGKLTVSSIKFVSSALQITGTNDLDFPSSASANISKCEFRNSPSYPLSFDSLESARIENCTFLSNTAACTIFASAEHRV